MRAALADLTVDTELVDGVPDAINTKDRHVIAAALASEPEATVVVVTNDDALRSEIFLLAWSGPTAGSPCGVHPSVTVPLRKHAARLARTGRVTGPR